LKDFISLCFSHSEKPGSPSITVSLFTETSPDNKPAFLKQFETVVGVIVSHASFITKSLLILTPCHPILVLAYQSIATLKIVWSSL
jgi:hypothetical protein